MKPKIELGLESRSFQLYKIFLEKKSESVHLEAKPRATTAMVARAPRPQISFRFSFC